MTNAFSTQRKAALLGAFDRFNYGDLLFPIVVQNEIISHSQDTKISVHALVQSDLSRYGALKTMPLNSLYKQNALHPGDTVIFAGGGTIGVDWCYMHSNLLGTTGNLALYYLKRLIGGRAANAFSRHCFGARAPFPWVAGPEDFPVPVKIAYNAVGGSEFSSLPPSVQAQTLTHLAKASYLSVRDAETKRLFAIIEESIAVELAPDSAILMSEQFPISHLKELASESLCASINAGPYVCFQANLSYALKHTDRIVATLEAIYEAYGLRAILLPIGRYVGLDDHVALRNILAKLRTPAETVSDEASIWEIMLTIAKARLFLGTSLHGNVTSQSFAIPHIGLSDRPCKLDYYLETWDLPEQAHCVQIDDVYEHAGRVLAIPSSALQEKRTELIARSHENFAKMAHACELVWLRPPPQTIKSYE